MSKALIYFIFLLFSFLLSWLYSNILAINLLWLLPLYFINKKAMAKAYFLAFFSGLVFDLVNLRLIGSSSLLFLAVTAVYFWQRQKLGSENNLTVLVFLVLTDIVIQLFLWKKVNPLETFLLIFLFVIWRFISNKNLFFWKKESEIFLR